MKLALVIGSLERGGTERQLVELVRGIHPLKAECVVVCLGEAGTLAAEVRATGAKVVAFGAHRMYDPRTAWALARTLRRERADVVYAFLFWGYSIGLPVARMALPQACRIQGRRSLPTADAPSRPGLEVLRRLADKLADGVIANSIAVGSAVARHEPSLHGRIWIVPNGVRTRATPAREAGAEVVIVCVANLIAYKGHETLLEAVRGLPPEGWRLDLVGDGPERARLEETIERHDLRTRVSLLGPRSDVSDILAGADIAVLPSYTEGMPNAVLEAMAHGLPVVATDVGGVRGLLGSGAGITVAPRNPVALGQALRTLLDDRNHRIALGTEGSRIVSQLLSVENMCEAAHDAILSVCQERAL